MAKRNGYFQIVIEGDNTFLHLVPAEDGGEKISIHELSDYLERKDFYFDILELDDCINSESDMMYLLEDKRSILESEMLKLDIAPDGMTVKGRFYPPFKGGPMMTKAEILGDLSYNDVVYGINEAEIDRFLVDREYCKDYILAQGKPFIESKDGKLEYMFKTDLSGRPTLNSDGSVDFFHLDNMCPCEPGEVLAVITPPDPGENGVNVWGDELLPHVPYTPVFRYGKNISVSPDGLRLIAESKGHVILDGDKVIVSNVLTVNNVDTSTGDLFFEGDIEVSGNVQSGFQVSATGNVTVRGVVEGAKVKAGGNIVIHRGVTGMQKGVLEAGGNVIVKYIENATVYAGGYVETDCILHSLVSSGDHVVVQGKKGFIAGGNVRALNYVEVKTLGSDVEVATTVEVGVDPQKRQKYNEMLVENKEARKKLDRLEPVVKAVGERVGRGEKLAPEVIAQLKDFSSMVSRYKDRIKRNNIDLLKLESEFKSSEHAQIRVTGKAYPNVRLIIADSAYMLRQVYHYCRFVKEEDEVIMKAL